jgi:hypothetical protein
MYKSGKMRPFKTIPKAIKVFYKKQKIIYDHQTTTTKDSPRNSAHRK